MTEQRNQLIDLLRVFSAFIIAVYHFTLHHSATETLFPAYEANQLFFRILASSVLTFFVISALVIPLQLIKNDYRLSHYPAFLLKRFLRVYLPFTVAILLIILVDLAFQVKNHQALTVDFRQLFANLTLSCEFVHRPWYSTIFWTLSIEIQFYLFIGLLFPLIKKYELKAVAVIFILGESVHFLFNDSRFLWYYTPYFTIGFGLYLWYLEKLTNLHLIFFMLVTGGFILLINEQLTIWTAVLIPALFLALKTSRIPFYRAGKFTFSFYLIHGLIGGHFIYFTRSWGNETSVAITRIALAIITAAIASWVFYHLVEKQSMKWMRFIRYRKN
ncbi:MAG: acyltransferase family protein [Bacteroidota bacterium]